MCIKTYFGYLNRSWYFENLEDNSFKRVIPFDYLYDQLSKELPSYCFLMLDNESTVLNYMILGELDAKKIRDRKKDG